MSGILLRKANEQIKRNHRLDNDKIRYPSGGLLYYKYSLWISKCIYLLGGFCCLTMECLRHTIENGRRLAPVGRIHSGVLVFACNLQAIRL